MYYEEKVIKGILYFRTTSNGPWQEMSKERLTELLEAERQKSNIFKSLICKDI